MLPTSVISRTQHAKSLLRDQSMSCLRRSPKNHLESAIFPSNARPHQNYRSCLCHVLSAIQSWVSSGNFNININNVVTRSPGGRIAPIALQTASSSLLHSTLDLTFLPHFNSPYRLPKFRYPIRTLRSLSPPHHSLPINPKTPTNLPPTPTLRRPIPSPLLLSQLIDTPHTPRIQHMPEA